MRVSRPRGKAVGAEHYIVAGRAARPAKGYLYDYIASRTKVALKQLLIGADGAYRGNVGARFSERGCWSAYVQTPRFKAP